MDGFTQFQIGLQGLLTLGGLGLMIFALVDALRMNKQAFPAAGKLTKNMWLLILGVAVAANIAILNILSIFGIAGVIAAAVYVLDVRPAVRQVGGGGRNRDDGPYGPW
ncbi:MAG: DUF2516 family protein [bacterium]